MKYAVSAISAESPDMDEDELRALEADIRENGQLVPILCRGRTVIDGRKRLAVCERIGIEPKVVQIGKRDPSAVARSANLLRTHYSASQRAMYAAKIANATQADAVNSRRDRKRVTNEGKFPSVTTRQEAADMLGVDVTCVGRAKHLRRTAAPEVVQAVEAGKITLHAATKIAAAVPKAEQAAVVRKIEAEGLGNAKRSVAKIVGDAPTPRRAKHTPASEKIETCIRTMETAVEVLTENWTAPDAANNPSRTEWTDRLRTVRTEITRMIREGANDEQED